MKIELWDFNRAGIIFPLTTGIIWTNQCGGTSCSHPEMEGIFVPLNTTPEDYGDECLWCDAWGFDYPAYLSEIEAVEKLWGFLVRVSEEEFNLLIRCEKGSIKDFYECGEAWIPVKVIKPEDYVQESKQLESFIGEVGILTYPNSD